MAEQQQVCPQCGHFNRLAAHFCAQCGYVFNPPSAAGEAVAPATEAPEPEPAFAEPAAGGSGSSGEREYCPACGKDVTPSAHFCRHCGQDLAAAAVSAPSPMAASQPPEQPATASVAAPARPVDGWSSQTEPFTRRSGVTPVVPLVAPTDPAAPSATMAPTAQPASRWLSALAGMLLGLVLGILIGGGIVLAAPDLVGLQCATEAPATGAPALRLPAAATPAGS